MEFQAAKGKVEVLEAELTGDSVQVAKAKLAVARRLLELASSSFKAGVLTASDYEKFTGNVTIAEAQLHEAEAKAKSSKLTDAKAPLAITAQDGKVVVTTPDSRLVADRIELGQTGAKANGDVAIAEAQARETADRTLAEQPPVVVETFPVSGTRDVAPGTTEIRVRFSKQMSDASWSWSTAWENSTPEFIGQPHYEADGRTCAAKVKLEAGRTYAFWLNSEKFQNFTSSAGRPAVPYLLIFQTKPK